MRYTFENKTPAEAIAALTEDGYLNEHVSEDSYRIEREDLWCRINEARADAIAFAGALRAIGEHLDSHIAEVAPRVDVWVQMAKGAVTVALANGPEARRVSSAPTNEQENSGG